MASLARLLISGEQNTLGADGKPVPAYTRECFAYTPGKSGADGDWRRINDVPVAVAAGSAVAVGQAHVLVFSGSSGANFDIPPAQRPEFPARYFAWHTITGTWCEGGAMPRGVVTTNAVKWGARVLIPSGEVSPGVRTPEVLCASPRLSSSEFGWANLIAMCLYPALMLGIGLHYAGKKKNTDDYFRGGQRVPWWAAGLSIFATMISSITFMTVPSKAFATDWSYYVGFLVLPLLIPLVTHVYLPFFRRQNLTSAYEYLERRFNLALRLFASASFIIFQVGRTAIVLYLPAQALATVSTLDIHWCIILMGALTIAMTVFGGMEAVIWTDVAQAGILLAAVGLSIAWIAGRCDGGLLGMFNTAGEHGRLFERVNWNVELSGSSIWMLAISNFATLFITYTSNQEVIQRYMTTKDTGAAARSIWLNTVMYVVTGALFLATGTALFVFYLQNPERLDPAVKIDSVFPLFMVRELPAGTAGFMVAAIFAAAQPTSNLNSISTAVVTDFYRRFVPKAEEARCMTLAKAVTVIAGVAGTAAAVAMAETDIRSLWDAFLSMLGLTFGIVGGLFALGLFTTRATGIGATAGVIVSVGLMWLVVRTQAVHMLMYGVVGVGASFVLGYVLSLIFPGRET